MTERDIGIIALLIACGIWTLLMMLPDVWGHRRILFQAATETGHPYIVMIGLYGTTASALWGLWQAATNLA